MTLKHRIGGKPLPIEQTIELGIQVADGLDAAHAKGSFIETSNPQTFLSLSAATPRSSTSVSQNSRQMMRIKCFFAAHRHSGRITHESWIAVGTIAYMSPEQARAEKLDPRSDLFSLGAVLYEMATGRMAFTGNSPAVIHDAILNRAPAPLAEAPLPNSIVSSQRPSKKIANCVISTPRRFAGSPSAKA